MKTVVVRDLTDDLFSLYEFKKKVKKPTIQTVVSVSSLRDISEKLPNWTFGKVLFMSCDVAKSP